MLYSSSNNKIPCQNGLTEKVVFCFAFFQTSKEGECLLGLGNNAEPKFAGGEKGMKNLKSMKSSNMTAIMKGMSNPQTYPISYLN